MNKSLPCCICGIFYGDYVVKCLAANIITTLSEVSIKMWKKFDDPCFYSVMRGVQNSFSWNYSSRRRQGANREESGTQRSEHWHGFIPPPQLTAHRAVHAVNSSVNGAVPRCSLARWVACACALLVSRSSHPPSFFPSLSPLPSFPSLFWIFYSYSSSFPCERIMTIGIHTTRLVWMLLAVARCWLLLSYADLRVPLMPLMKSSLMSGWALILQCQQPRNISIIIICFVLIAIL